MGSEILITLAYNPLFLSLLTNLKGREIRSWNDAICRPLFAHSPECLLEKEGSAACAYPPFSPLIGNQHHVLLSPGNVESNVFYHHLTRNDERPTSF